MLGLDHVRWADWRAAHPDTTVLARPVDATGEHLAPYDRTPARGPGEPGLSAGTLVHGILVGSDAFAFPLPLMMTLAVAEVTVGSVPLVAAYAAADVHVWRSEGRSFTSPEDGLLEDPQGRRYDALTGRSVHGDALRGVQGNTMYWFAWQDFHPQTRILEEAPSQVEASSEARAPGASVLGLILAVTGVGVMARWRR